jgi:hypothetical protein
MTDQEAERLAEGDVRSPPAARAPADPRALVAASALIGAFAVGAIAVGAVAIGALAIGRLSVGRVRLRRVEIDDLLVRRSRGVR